VNIFLPLVVAVGTSNVVGDFFTRSLYERAVRGKQMPIIANMVPHCNKFLRAEKIMNPNVVSLKVVDTVENIFNAIKDSGHHAYPIVNSQKRGVGLVFSNFLITLMKKKHFYDQKKET
jgi:predicted transcriptional regulator